MIKKISLVLLSALLVACASSSIIIPDISKVDEATAKTLLAQKSLIPNIEYEFSDSIDAGLVIKSDPVIGSKAKPDDKILIYVSKGPKKISATDSNVTWEDGRDKFQYYQDPYIEDGYFVLDVELKFSKNYELENFEDNGSKGYGRASISDTFDKVVPVIVETEDKLLDSKDYEKLRIKIPVGDLDVQKPTTLYFQIYFKGKTYDMNVSATW
jgi:hypothetical protein